MFVAPVGNTFMPPYSELLSKTSDQLFEAGISQLYERLTQLRRTQRDDSRLVPIYKNGSTEDQNRSLDFSVDDPQGKIAFYLALIGMGLGLIVVWTEMACNSIKCASTSVHECTKRWSSKAHGAIRLFIAHLFTPLRPKANHQEGEVIMVKTGQSQS